jgi:hypothetical protein
MIALLSFFLILLVSPLKSKSRLEAENAALRHQLIVLRRKVRGRWCVPAIAASASFACPQSEAVGRCSRSL